MTLHLPDSSFSVWQLLLHDNDAYDGRIRDSALAAALNNKLEELRCQMDGGITIWYVGLISPDDSGLRRWRVEWLPNDSNDNVVGPADRVYTVEQARKALPCYIVKLLDELDKKTITIG